jgi:hypothetical protein
MIDPDKYYESIFIVVCLTILKSGHAPLSLGTLSKSQSLLDDRRLGKLGSGALALVPYLAQRGDIVCMLAGDDMPLLLRPIELSPNEQQTTMDAEIQKATENHEKVLQYRHYLYVGECWVEGSMSVTPKDPPQQQERRSRFGLTDECLVLH